MVFLPPRPTTLFGSQSGATPCAARSRCVNAAMTPGARHRVSGVDGDDTCVRVRRANDPGMRLVCAFDVVDESATADEQGGVFAPRDARADGGDGCAGHCLVLSQIAAGH